MRMKSYTQDMVFKIPPEDGVCEQPKLLVPSARRKSMTSGLGRLDAINRATEAAL